MACADYKLAKADTFRELTAKITAKRTVISLSRRRVSPLSRSLRITSVSHQAPCKGSPPLFESSSAGYATTDDAPAAGAELISGHATAGFDHTETASSDDFHGRVVIRHAAWIESTGGNDHVNLGPMRLQTARFDAVNSHSS